MDLHISDDLLLVFNNYVVAIPCNQLNGEYETFDLIIKIFPSISISLFVLQSCYINSCYNGKVQVKT